MLDYKYRTHHNDDESKSKLKMRISFLIEINCKNNIRKRTQRPIVGSLTIFQCTYKKRKKNSMSGFWNSDQLDWPEIDECKSHEQALNFFIFDWNNFAQWTNWVESKYWTTSTKQTERHRNTRSAVRWIICRREKKKKSSWSKLWTLIDSYQHPHGQNVWYKNGLFQFGIRNHFIRRASTRIMLNNEIHWWWYCWVALFFALSLFSIALLCSEWVPYFLIRTKVQ